MVQSNPLNELTVKNEKYVKNCTELYMAHCHISEIRNFERFVNLEVLWLNGNDISALEGLDQCFRIKELYLQDNGISSLRGSSLSRFHFLHILRLSNNTLSDLHTTLQFLSKLHHLTELDLFGNPLAEESNYRSHVIHTIPSLTIFDRHQITDEERLAAKRLILRQEKLQQSKGGSKTSNQRSFSSSKKKLRQSSTSGGESDGRVSSTVKLLMKEVRELERQAKVREAEENEALARLALQGDKEEENSGNHRHRHTSSSSSSQEQSSLLGLDRWELAHFRTLCRKWESSSKMDARVFREEVLESMKDHGKVLCLSTKNSSSSTGSLDIELLTDAQGQVQWTKCLHENISTSDLEVQWKSMPMKDILARASAFFDTAKTIQRKAMSLPDRDELKTALLQEAQDLSCRACRLENLGTTTTVQQKKKEGSSPRSSKDPTAMHQRDIFTISRYYQSSPASPGPDEPKKYGPLSSDQIQRFNIQSKDFQNYLTIKSKKLPIQVSKETYQL